MEAFSLNESWEIVKQRLLMVKGVRTRKLLPQLGEVGVTVEDRSDSGHLS